MNDKDEGGLQQSAGEYEVGYGKPPSATRFQKGQSGNPKGRPKGVKNLSTILEEELEQKVAVTENGRRKKITKRRATVKQLVNKAASGDHRSVQILINSLNDAEKRAASAPDNPQLGEIDQEIVSGVFERLRVDKRDREEEND
jgi:hypothetical protein